MDGPIILPVFVPSFVRYLKVFLRIGLLVFSDFLHEAKESVL